MLVIGLDAASDFGKFGYAVGLYEKGQMRIEQAGLLEGTGQNNTLDSVLVSNLGSQEPFFPPILMFFSRAKPGQSWFFSSRNSSSISRSAFMSRSRVLSLSLR